MELNFELKVNSSEFIEKTEQLRSAMRTTALEIEEQGQKVSLSFQQMADKVSFTTDIVGKAIKGMQEQIIAAIASLYELDSENQSRLAGLRKDFGESLDKDSSDGQDQKTSVSTEIDSRENLSEISYLTIVIICKTESVKWDFSFVLKWVAFLFKFVLVSFISFSFSCSFADNS